VINRVEFPTLSYQDNVTDEETDDKPKASGFFGILFGNTNSSLRSATGTLTKSSADSFLDEAKGYVVPERKHKIHCMPTDFAKTYS